MAVKVWSVVDIDMMEVRVQVGTRSGSTELQTS